MSKCVSHLTGQGLIPLHGLFLQVPAPCPLYPHDTPRGIQIDTSNLPSLASLCGAGCSYAFDFLVLCSNSPLFAKGSYAPETMAPNASELF
jgi:hypothetical protein